MTAYLLDTNAFAMALTDDPRLPEQTRVLMGQADRIALSVVSLNEIGQKVRLGKWPDMAPHVHTLEQQARTDGYDLVPLTGPASLRAALLDWAHRDPFDRMIAVVAQLETLTVLSSVIAFDDIGVARHWD